MGSALVFYTVACFSNVASVDALVTHSIQCPQELNESITKDVSILNLSGLRLRRSYSDCLRHYNQLQVLLLNTSNLDTLDDTTFSNISSIKELYLQDNRLIEFPSKPMVPLTQLQVLVINNNYIKEIKSDAFQDLKELRQLHLGPQVQFQSFEYQALLPLKNVKVLVLRGLNLTFVPVINQMRLLQDLDLSDNKIDRVLSQYFYNLTKLQTLQLITFISKSAFSSQKNLRLLDLSGNGLVTLFKETLSPMIQSAGGAVVVQLAQNPFHCDASMCPMKRWLDTIKLPVQLDMMCNSPESLRGHWMTQLPLTNFNCVKEPIFTLLPKASHINKTAIAHSFLGKGITGIIIVAAAATSLLLISISYLASAKLIHWSFLRKHCTRHSAESTQQGKEEAATNSIRPYGTTLIYHHKNKTHDPSP
ncbi:leucine-rich repeat-containing protein 4B-like [Pristis pectinata]|uniref:leucine-rich repeat-containing protein 4B-like n=1 Tax=Pristis pectinata TaxID=685728 RepID=UPI00223D7D0E|nr:leucine-rich repeat-containing protein 4B-like [Pristis pectinata]